MNERQKKAMIEFHRKAEKAYRESGQAEQAERAKAQREKLEKACASRSAADRGDHRKCNHEN